MNKLLRLKIVNTLKQGGVIAYPTEAVYGLGCDPFNEAAVKKILNIKKRSVEKGLIMLGSDWSQLEKFTAPIPAKNLQKIFGTWPGPTTWIFPAAFQTPRWLTGKFSSIALRVTNHPLAKDICQEFGAIVSTSANVEGEPPAKTADEVAKTLTHGIDYIVEGKVGSRQTPSTIIDALTGKIIRK